MAQQAARAGQEGGRLVGAEIADGGARKKPTLVMPATADGRVSAVVKSSTRGATNRPG